jgi:predicted Rossmann-fold nucleotide-binding protein
MPVAKVPINDPKHWRKRVEEARTLAHKITDKKGKARMLQLAKQYEKLAEKAEQRSRERSKNAN